ncbi:MAG: membrane lipoprotein lipid attachment site-containing protein [Chitinophagaceae bacterium]
MKNIISFILILFALAGCNTSVNNEKTKQTSKPMQGTWKLLTGTLVEKGDTIVTDYTKGKEFIKIINDTHFAFLSHSLAKGKNSAADYSSGGGHYTLKDSNYTEHLEYCSDRQWEGNDFNFIVTINNDTLTQKGIEKIDSLGINRINIERYVRLKDKQ